MPWRRPTQASASGGRRPRESESPRSQLQDSQRPCGYQQQRRHQRASELKESCKDVLDSVLKWDTGCTWVLEHMTCVPLVGNVAYGLCTSGSTLSSAEWECRQDGGAKEAKGSMRFQNLFWPRAMGIFSALPSGYSSLRMRGFLSWLIPEVTMYRAGVKPEPSGAPNCSLGPCCLGNLSAPSLYGCENHS